MEFFTVLRGVAAGPNWKQGWAAPPYLNHSKWYIHGLSTSVFSEHLQYLRAFVQSWRSYNCQQSVQHCLTNWPTPLGLQSLSVLDTNWDSKSVLSVIGQLIWAGERSDCTNSLLVYVGGTLWFELFFFKPIPSLGWHKAQDAAVVPLYNRVRVNLVGRHFLALNA